MYTFDGMVILKSIFYIFWRLWFYTWFLASILILLPVLVIVIYNENRYPLFFKIAHYWGKTLLFVMGFAVAINAEERLEKNKSYLFCPNHTSMIDIMLMLAITKTPFVFIGKKELAKIPIFGHIYKRTCILVDREDKQSRVAVFEAAEQKLKKNLSVCIFPEGKVPDDESVVLDNFQNGTFRLAIEHQIPIVPISFFDCKKRFSYTFFSGAPGKLRVKIHSFIHTKNKTMADRNSLKNETYQVLLKSLENDFSYMESCGAPIIPSITE